MKNKFKNVKLKNIPMAPKKCHTNVLEDKLLGKPTTSGQVTFMY